MKVTIGRDGSFAAADTLQGSGGIIMPASFEIHAPTGVQVSFTGLAGATAIKKGTQSLALAATKVLTADNSRPFTVEGPQDTLRVTTGS